MSDNKDGAGRSPPKYWRLTADKDRTTEILNDFGDRSLSPLQGGPVEYPLNILSSIWYLIWFCDPYAGFMIRMVLPDDVDQETLHWPYEEKFAQPPGKRIDIRIEGGGAVPIKEILEYAGQLPDKSMLEVVSSNKNTTGAGQQCYSGVIWSGQWRITATYPSLQRQDLDNALELCRMIDQPGPIAAVSKDEAAAVIALSKTSGSIMPQSLYVSQDDNVYISDAEPKINLALTFFRIRFRDKGWNVAEAQERDEREQARQNKIIQEITESFAAPHTGRVIFKGRTGRFFLADLHNVPPRPWLILDIFIQILPNMITACQALRHWRIFDAFRALRRTVTWEKPSPTERIEKLYAAVKDSGFTCLGDMVYENTKDIIFRVLIHSSGDTYAVLMLGTAGQYGLDMFTWFDNGESQTTTTNGDGYIIDQSGKDLLPLKGLYITFMPDVGSRDLYTAHCGILDKRIAEGVRPVILTPTLEAFAESFDEYWYRKFNGN